MASAVKQNVKIVDGKCQGAVKVTILNVTVRESLIKKVIFEKDLQ